MWGVRQTAFVGPAASLRRLSTRAIPNRRSICMETAKPKPRTAATARPRPLPPAMRAVVPSGDLLSFVEDKAYRRSDVVRAVSEYVREHNLQDPSNKQIVYCDEALTSLLGVEQCTMLQISKYVNPYLKKPAEVGGRYIDEARKLEDEYLDKVKNAPPAEKSTRKRGVNRMKNSNSGLFKPVRLSPQLAALCDGRTVMPRQDIIKAVWAYVKRNNLKGPPGAAIKCDPPMERVFGTKELSVQGVMKGIGVHLTKID